MGRFKQDSEVNVGKSRLSSCALEDATSMKATKAAINKRGDAIDERERQRERECVCGWVWIVKGGGWMGRDVDNKRGAGRVHKGNGEREKERERKVETRRLRRRRESGVEQRILKRTGRAVFAVTEVTRMTPVNVYPSPHTVIPFLFLFLFFLGIQCFQTRDPFSLFVATASVDRLGVRHGTSPKCPLCYNVTIVGSRRSQFNDKVM